MTQPPTLADWVPALSLGVSSVGLIALVLAFADADLADLDPRRLLDTGPGARAVVAVFNAKTAVREAALDLAALVILLTASPEATR